MAILTAQDLSNNLSVYCPIWGGIQVRTVREWLDYRLDCINELNFNNLVSVTYVDAIDKELNRHYGHKWWNYSNKA